MVKRIKKEVEIEKEIEIETIEDAGPSDLLPLLPLKNVVLLPKSIRPIIVGRPLSIKAVEFALKHNRSIFITAQIDDKVENPGENDVFHHGTRSNILQVMRTPTGALKILAEGICRSQAKKFIPNEEFINVICEDSPTTSLETTIDIEAIWRQIQTLYATYSALNEKVPADLTNAVKTTSEMDYATDTIAVHITSLTIIERQAILERADLKERMLKLCSLLRKEIDILQAEQRIQGTIQTQVEKGQREYYLTEQIKAIQKELGREDQATEIEQIRAKLKSLKLPKEALEKAQKELRRLEQMPPLSSEAVVSRNYIDWIISLPWHKVTKDTISLPEAEAILDESHAGLKRAKERIIEFLAAKKFSNKLERSPIICLIGPPGVGKTSLARSISQSLGREFVRISLGGVRDEAEIRGHRRTYIGALPGKIIQAMKKAKTMNPVILLDEIDKMSRDLHGDPAAALLEVLDPEQNKNFADHFLDIEYDLSQVMFIATANVTENIPYPLFDRLEIIQLSGYTEEEKLAIAKEFLLPKNLVLYSLSKNQFSLTDEVISFIISNYTRESGVRQLERVIAKLMRKVIQELLKSPNKKKKVIVDIEKTREWLGHPLFKKTSLSVSKDRIGLATGLAWTEVGGDVLEIETTVLTGKGQLTLTGQLGDVMQESAHAAMSYIRSRANELGLKKTFHTTTDIHLHIPEGATPKDGPSAGIAICTALISALIKTPAKAEMAMTGEVTLQGRVLAVGGLKEKLLAAKQYGLKTVLLPHENYEEVQEILKEVNLEGVHLIFVKTMDEVLGHAFGKDIFCGQKAKKPVKRSSKPEKK